MKLWNPFETHSAQEDKLCMISNTKTNQPFQTLKPWTDEVNNRDQLSTGQCLARTPGIPQSRECSVSSSGHLHTSAEHT